MKTIFDPAARAALIERINALDGSRPALWGKMTACQMVTHCHRWEAWIQGKPPRAYEHGWLGRIFGRLALWNLTKDDRPFARNLPTSAEFTVTDTTGDIGAEKGKWIALLHDYDHYSNPGFIHDFFGRMTREQVGRLAYKHTDHHLRQFGA